MLSCELKHLLLETSLGLCLAQLPVDKNISLRWVKSVLGVAETFLADLSKHFKANPLVRPYTVSVLVEPFWSLPHLIDREVFERELMTTDDGTLFGYGQFDPRILKYTPTHMAADFDAPIPAHRLEMLQIFKLPDEPPCDQQAGWMGGLMQLALTATGIYSAYSDYATVRVVRPGHIQLLIRDAP